ncbi:MAG: DUF1571 domain-containing protein [Planctomycetaceae bacterium]|nr:DUF1571 domain-containing protein [Planctomycetaceae bacterium]
MTLTRLVRIPVLAPLIAMAFVISLGTAASAQTQIATRISEVPESHPLMPALRAGQKALTEFDEVTDYEAVFVKKEIVGGQMIEQRMQIRFREKPFSVRLKFIEPNEGREVLYIDGRNGNKMLVQETGLASLVGPVSLDPRGSLAMQHTVHPITQIGVKNMMHRLLDVWLAESDQTQIDVKFYPNARIGKTSCEVIEATHPQQAQNITYHKVRLYVDKDSGLPIRVQHLGFPKGDGAKEPIIADYAYLSMKTNIGLTDRDFAIGN